MTISEIVSCNIIVWFTGPFSEKKKKGLSDSIEQGKGYL